MGSKRIPVQALGPIIDWATGTNWPKPICLKESQRATSCEKEEAELFPISKRGKHHGKKAPVVKVRDKPY